MLTQKSLDFLKDLAKNNNRDWFQTNKTRYEVDLKKPFEDFVGQIIQEIRKVDERVTVEPKKAIFRIHRDTRFSKDKTPYKNNVGAIISPKGKDEPGLYIHIEHGMLMLGGGAYFLEKEQLYKVRQQIMMHSEQFHDIINKVAFKEKFGTIQGEKNKKLPVEFQEAAVQQPLLYNKQFYAMAELDPKEVLREDAVGFVLEYYKAIKPLNDFLLEVS